MGWGRTLLLGDIGTQLNVNDVEADVEAVKEHLASQDARDESHEAAIDRLQNENHELKIYIATLVRLLVNKSVLSSEDVTKFVALLDP